MLKGTYTGLRLRLRGSVHTSFPKPKLWVTYLSISMCTYREISLINSTKNCLKGCSPCFWPPLTPKVESVQLQWAPLADPTQPQQHFNKSSFSTLYNSHVNANCLHNKLNYVRDLSNEKSLHITGISETWLNSTIPDSYVVFISGFQLFRDTVGTGNKHGVCLYISNSLKCIPLDKVCPNVITVHLTCHNLFIFMAYHPPSNSLEQNQALIN